MEKFEQAFMRDDDSGDNILQVSVTDNLGNPLPAKDIKVEIVLSKNAMLELGAELIERVLGNKYDGKHWHLEPSKMGNAVSTLGVFLHPSSPEVIVIHDEFGQIESLF